MAEWKMEPGTWEDAEAAVGRHLATTVGADEVTLAAIRAKLEVCGFDCPIHYDEEVAQQLGYRTVVAPASMLLTWATEPYWSPGDPAPKPGDPCMTAPFAATSVPAPCHAITAIRCETEYLEPVYPGDRITSNVKLASVVRKRTRIGDGAFMVLETTYTKQSGEVVGLEHMTVFRYEPDGQSGDES